MLSKNCDCCNIEIRYSEFTIINKHDTQLFICEDCLQIVKEKEDE